MLHLAAYALDCRYKFTYLTDEAIKLCFEAIVRIAIKSGIPFNYVRAGLTLDLEIYRSEPTEPLMTDPKVWWRSQTSYPVLSQVAQRLLSIEATSANIERLFSSLKCIQGDYRQNLSSSTLVDLARTRMAYMDDPKPENVELNGEIFDKISDEFKHNLSNWIENRHMSVKRDYQNFFNYFDFTLIRECNSGTETSNLSVTDDQVRDFVAPIAARGRPIVSNVIIDDQDALEEFDQRIDANM